MSFTSSSWAAEKSGPSPMSWARTRCSARQDPSAGDTGSRTRAGEQRLSDLLERFDHGELGRHAITAARPWKTAPDRTGPSTSLIVDSSARGPTLASGRPTSPTKWKGRTHDESDPDHSMQLRVAALRSCRDASATPRARPRDDVHARPPRRALAGLRRSVEATEAVLKAQNIPITSKDSRAWTGKSSGGLRSARRSRSRFGGRTMRTARSRSASVRSATRNLRDLFEKIKAKL